MRLVKDQRLKTAKLIGCVYFLLLALINLFATFFYAKLNTIDVIILFFGLLPMLINRKQFLLVFGLLAGFLSLYMGFACLTFNLNSTIQTSQVSYNMGYLLAAASLISSLLLVYVGVNMNAESRLDPV